MVKINPLVEQMTSFIVMDVLERAQELEKEGKDIVHLEVGEPDFDLSEIVRDAAEASFAQKRTHYTHSLGDKELRLEIARFYQREYGVTIDPDQVIVTSGSSPAILMALMVLCEPGSEVILSDPGYPCYKNFVLACNAKPVSVDLSPEDGFQYSIEKIKKAIEKMNSQLPHSEAKFGIHEATNRVMIKLVDKDTQEVIKEIPPEKTLDMIAKCMELAGVLVDEKL